ncbi:lob domain-containing protein 20 [Quercus suber]|uniref:Lob domain-containing protein 20 n=1 Tax=Quercus suber TaxID=58331 RepID=A0AAW0MAQ6_QUESU
MAETRGGDSTSRNRRKGMGKRTMATVEAEPVVAAMAPCGACKFLRRKCINGCIFAPHFGSDQGAARFAAVHKVFGASNVSKLLLHIPVHQRHDAVVTISYEAQARLSDPVYGCVSTVLALQQQNSQQQQQRQNIAVLQPAYSNNSSASNNLISMSAFTSNFDIVAETAPSPHSLEPLQLSRPSQDEEEDEEESHIPHVFGNEILHRS